MSQTASRFKHDVEIEHICHLQWEQLTPEEQIDVVWAFSFFSTQFRENLATACALYPDDEKLERLKREECDTDNLSPWPYVAEKGEKMNHDDFRGRMLTLYPIDDVRRERLEQLGTRYLERMRAFPADVRASSIASYEQKLDNVFRAMLRSPQWDLPILAAFKHFLVKHIEMDSDPSQGHGVLCRHLTVDDSILPLWTAFKQLLVEACPKLSST